MEELNRFLAKVTDSRHNSESNAWQYNRHQVLEELGVSFILLAVDATLVEEMEEGERFSSDPERTLRTSIQATWQLSEDISHATRPDAARDGTQFHLMRGVADDALAVSVGSPMSRVLGLAAHVLQEQEQQQHQQRQEEEQEMVRGEEGEIL
jgi:hypothetical protein